MKRQRKNSNEPAWVQKFLRSGQPPQRGEDGYDAYVGWKFFGDEVEGMVDAITFYFGRGRQGR